jgi:hypothetical protein
MKLKSVKLNPHNRVKILCHYCEEMHHELETYAIVEHKFKYICVECVSHKMSRGQNIEIIREV